MTTFIGRESEIKALLAQSRKKKASFVVLRGRRRIGKSRLAEELAQYFDKFYRFEGLAPDHEVTAADQLAAVSKQISQQFKAPFAPYQDWSDALWAIGQRVQKGKILILFDEISWMGMDEPTFLANIKIFWDQHLKKNPQLMFIVCGSASSWIEENILSGTGFVGRISYTLTLEELPLSDCNRFWPKNIAAFEKLKILAITGGIPKYLEEVNPKLPAEENIRQLCFSRGGFLVEEFRQIFSDLFLRDSMLYQKIVTTLVSGPKERNEICAMLNIDPNGRISEYLAELELSGFIKRDYTWDIKTGADAKLSQYRLSDNYLRFYLRYIDKNLTKIHRGSFQIKSLTTLPEWNTILALQFENLILNNKSLIREALGIASEDIVSENPFYQRKTSRTAGCQIDYMIQTKFNTLYVCEIKFSKNLVDASVITEVQQKIAALKHPRAYSCRPVLIHVNGVTEDIVDRDYFAHLIDFSSYLC